MGCPAPYNLMGLRVFCGGCEGPGVVFVAKQVGSPEYFMGVWPWWALDDVWGHQRKEEGNTGKNGEGEHSLVRSSPCITTWGRGCGHVWE